jgi:hypothetical protein
VKTAAEALRFEARLLLPDEARATWAFVHVPKAASQKLRTRGQIPVAGTLNGTPFRGLLEPDGSKGHWLKVTAAQRKKSGAVAGGVVAFSVAPAEHEPTVPADLRRALAGAAGARATWKDITPAARRDWIHWITSAKQAETRARRISAACDMLAGGKRRVCCFDRSGAYSKNLGAPRAR